MIRKKQIIQGAPNDDLLLNALKRLLTLIPEKKNKNKNKKK